MIPKRCVHRYSKSRTSGTYLNSHAPAGLWRGHSKSILDNSVEIFQVVQIEIRNFFENNTHEYFCYEILPKSDWDGNGGFDRIDFFHPNMQSRGKVTLVTKFFSKVINKINLKLVIPVLKVCGIKRKKDEISFYGGPNWMDLTGTCVSQIISFIDSNPNYVKRFKYTRCADEIFFQTLILNYVKNVHLSNKLLRYIDWSSGPEYPRVLRITDYTKMKDSSCLFARKVDDRIDNEIINQIYSELKA